MKVNHIPLRKCVGCFEMFPKSELFRIVKTKQDNNFFLDQSGKSQGRGTYICKKIKCLKTVQKSKKLSSAFKNTIDLEVRKEMEF